MHRAANEKTPIKIGGRLPYSYLGRLGRIVGGITVAGLRVSAIAVDEPAKAITEHLRRRPSVRSEAAACNQTVDVRSADIHFPGYAVNGQQRDRFPQLIGRVVVETRME
jgi:hypothetical protein